MPIKRPTTPVDDRCADCKEFDKDGCYNCGPLTIAKVFNPAELGKGAAHRQLVQDAQGHHPKDACPEECILCGVRDCPYENPLHYHHDGCPACQAARRQAKEKEQSALSDEELRQALSDTAFERMVRAAGCKPTLEWLGWMRWAYEQGRQSREVAISMLEEERAAHNQHRLDLGAALDANPGDRASYIAFAQMICAAHRESERKLGDVIAHAEESGWNGVENPKDLCDYIVDTAEQLRAAERKLDALTRWKPLSELSDDIPSDLFVALALAENPNDASVERVAFLRTLLLPERYIYRLMPESFEVMEKAKTDG